MKKNYLLFFSKVVSLCLLLCLGNVAFAQIPDPTDVSTAQTTCVGESVTLQATCAQGIVEWFDTVGYIGDGEVEVSPTITTTYQVICRTPCDDFSNSVQVVVTVVRPFNVTTEQALCDGNSIDLEATCPSGDVVWYGSDTTAPLFTGTSYPVTLTETTIYNVRCENTSYSCENSPFETFTIHVPESQNEAPTTVSPSRSACQGEEIPLSATCEEDNVPVWYLADGTTPLGGEIVTVIATATYRVRCENTEFLVCAGPFVDITITMTSSITTQPVSQLVCPGETATFTAEADGTNTYQWQKRQANGLFANIEGATSGTLTIATTALSDKGFYRCHIVGSCNFYSDEVFLTFLSVLVDKGRLIGSDTGVEDMFGTSVAVSDSLAVVGAAGKDLGEGAAYIFKMKPDGKWAQVFKLAPDDLEEDDLFGSAVAISGDTIFVGAPGRYSGWGAVYVFAKNGINTWEQLDYLDAGNGGLWVENFGCGLSVSGRTLVVGADLFDGGYGKIYIFEKNVSDNWVRLQSFSPHELDSQSHFGYSVSVSGDVIAVGAEGDNLTGTVYVYERNINDGWTQKTVLSPDDASAFMGFGYSVSVNGNQIIAGAPGQGAVGAAYIFERSGSGNWSEKTKLVPTGISDLYAFGYAVAISGVNAVVSASSTSLKGSAFVYELTPPGTWTQKSRLIPASTSLVDQYGFAVALSGKTLLVSSILEGTPPYSVERGFVTFHSLFTAPAATINTVTQNAAVCPAQKATLNLTGLPAAGSYTITYKIGSGGTEKTTVITADTLGFASFQETLVLTDNGKSLIITKAKNSMDCELVQNKSTTLIVKAPTVIVSHPQNEIVCQGETASFIAEATGEGILTFQWQRQVPLSNGVTLPITNSFVDIGVLTLPNRMPSDSGTIYRVKVAGECGVVTSDEAVLSVLRKAVVTVVGEGAVCPGASGSLIFTGTPHAQVTYQGKGVTSTVTLNSAGTATVSTGTLYQDTQFNLLSIEVSGRCARSIDGGTLVSIKLTSNNPPRTLSSPVNDVLPNDDQMHAAQTITATNKIESGGKQTLTGNKSVVLLPGFVANRGSVFVAKVSDACL